MKFKYTKIFALIALVLSIILFFNSSSILIYFLNVFFSIIAIGLIGLGIDFLINKRIKGIIFLAISLGIIIIFVVVNFFTQSMVCGYSTRNLENRFTNECKIFHIGCNNKAPWYYIQSDKCSIEMYGQCSDIDGIVIHFQEDCPENYSSIIEPYHDVRPGYKCCLPE